MSTTTLARTDESPADGALVVRPQTTIGVAAEQQRVQAEIQSRLMVARSCPRDEVDAIDRIKTACQRPGLAEKSEYSYSRGGTEITGPTIDLLTVIANHWGNVDYGFRELSQANRESTVECFAWDLETNAKRTAVVTVPHKRFTRNGSTDLTDPRDIYETVANYAQRRVRSCLEAIIPPDVVEDAVAQCRETLKACADVNPEAIKKLTVAFAAMGVTKEQIEKRLGRRIDTMQPAQLVSLRRVYKSMHDGMSKPGDWFEVAEAAPKSAAEAAKDALRSTPVGTQSVVEPDAADRPQTASEPDPMFLEEVAQAAAALDSEAGVKVFLTEYLGRAQVDAERTTIEGLALEARKRIKNAKGKQGTLAGT